MCGKTKLLSDAAIDSITDLVIYIVAPCLMISSFQREFDGAILGGFITALLVAVAVHLFNIAFAHIAVRDKDNGREVVFRFAIVFSNCGFMAITLQNALLGSDGVFYGAALSVSTISLCGPMALY